jgi:antirestriction protein ArdC
MTSQKDRPLNVTLFPLSSNDPWMTYRHAQTKGYQVRGGEKGTQVQYWRFDEERKIKDSNGRPVIDANGEPHTEKVRLERPQVLVAYVFNAEQIEGVPPAPSREPALNTRMKSRCASAAQQDSHEIQRSKCRGGYALRGRPPQRDDNTVE